jgi:hypothetical protein
LESSAADHRSFDGNGFLTLFAQGPGEDFARYSATNDKVLKALDRHDELQSLVLEGKSCFLENCAMRMPKGADSRINCRAPGRLTNGAQNATCFGHGRIIQDRQKPGERFTMKIIVVGGTGLIGKKVVMNLRQHRHEVVAASPLSGVNTVTGEGLTKTLAGAQVVVDVANAPS